MPEELTQTERERLIIQYLASSERGDLDSIYEILGKAENDGILSEMIMAAEAERMKEEMTDAETPDYEGFVLHVEEWDINGLPYSRSDLIKLAARYRTPFPQNN